MNKKKGFTLIELLAVVIIIGLIALISVPVINNIVKGAKQKTLDKQISVVLESAKNWAIKNIDLLPENSGSILVKMDTLKKNGYLENKTITNPIDKSEMNGCAEILYNANAKQYEYEYNETCSSNNGLLANLATTNSDLEVKSIAKCATDGTKCEPGTAFAIKVNNEDIYKFYVIADDKNEVILIMDRNIGDEVAWLSKIDYTTISGSETDYDWGGNNNLGPITVLNYLNSQTSNWTNINGISSYEYNNNLNGTTNTCGYQKLIVTNGTGVLTSQDGTITTNLAGTMRARLLTLDEWSSLITANSDTTPNWLYGNLCDLTTTEKPRGYWLLTSYDSSPTYAWYMYDVTSDGILGYDYNVYLDDYVGLRPVITLSKTTPIY